MELLLPDLLFRSLWHLGCLAAGFCRSQIEGSACRRGEINSACGGESRACSELLSQTCLFSAHPVSVPWELNLHKFSQGRVSGQLFFFLAKMSVQAEQCEVMLFCSSSPDGDVILPFLLFLGKYYVP